MGPNSLAKYGPMVLGVGIMTVAGCAPRLVVVRHDAQSPIVAVLPSDHTTDEAAFAEYVEGEVAAFGVRIVERPPFRFANTTPRMSAESSSSGGGLLGFASQGKAASTPITDVVSMYEDAAADYLFITHSQNRNVRMIRKKDKTLVGSLRLGKGNKGAAMLRHALVRSGMVTNPKYTADYCDVMEEWMMDKKNAPALIK